MSSACYCCTAITLGAFFMLNRDSHYSNPNSPFPSDVLPQYIVLALLIVLLVAHTIIRHKAAKPSALATVQFQLPWQEMPGHDSSGMLSRVAVRTMRFARCAFIVSAAEFVTSNYLVLSQIAMVTTGLFLLCAAVFRRDKVHGQRCDWLHSLDHQRSATSARCCTMLCLRLACLLQTQRK